MMCADCTLAFFQSTFKVALILISLLISLASLIFLKTKKELSVNKKIALIYIHIFGLLFPFFFYIFFNGCSALFSSCGTAKATVYLVIVTGITAAVLGAILAPLLFLSGHKRNASEIKEGFAAALVREKSEELMIKAPKLYRMNTAQPIAFSCSLFEPSIFISAGMADILDRKELEAVLLHELSHIKNSSSKLKFSTSIMSILSPAAHIATLSSELSKEEKEADEFAIKCQNTSIHLNSVKSKLLEYETECARGG